MGMSRRFHMPRFDWYKEHPAWKLAAWVVIFIPATLTAAASFIWALHALLRGTLAS